MIIHKGWGGSPKKRQKDVIRKDLKNVSVDEDKWYDDAGHLVNTGEHYVEQ